jgi:putative glutamine amidotransferase
MKRIGITYTETNFKNYPAWFTKEDLGDEFELVILSFEEKNVDDIARCDGFVLTGGIDIDPTLYEGDMDYPNRPANFSTARDQFEATVYWYAKEKRLPVLGICRGMQLIHVLEGGELIQDLGEQNAKHRSDGKDKEHSIEISKGSLLHTISGQLEGTVNSAHHQALYELLGGGANASTGRHLFDYKSGNPDFVLNALAWDIEGANENVIIEGFEYRDKYNHPWLLCVQWHPERMKDKESNPLSKKIKEAFLAAVKKLKNEDHQS